MSSSILVTGATGTFGRAFLRSCFASGQFRRVIGFSRDEVKQSQLATEFADEPSLRLFIGDVRDAHRLSLAMQDVDTVVHAAALKRVDAGAYSPSEMIQTNVMGTMNVVNAAITAGVSRVVVISSDKAVQATNIYGATKFCAENYAVAANAYARNRGTRIAAVRYGNVLGSRGSVIHIWRDHIAKGQPMLLTSPDMTRFVMTIEQAVQLVWYARMRMYGGEVFVPILPSAKMGTLAEAMTEDGQWPMRIVGLRPGGEKLAEWLLSSEEISRTYRSSDRYLTVVPSHHDWTTGEDWVKAAGGTWLLSPYEYRSDVNRYLSAPDLRTLIASSEACR